MQLFAFQAKGNLLQDLNSGTRVPVQVSSQLYHPTSRTTVKKKQNAEICAQIFPKISE